MNNAELVKDLQEALASDYHHMRTNALFRRAIAALSQQAEPEYRGYANLGTGQYCLNHSASGNEPELVVSIATDEEKANRAIGEERDNPPGKVIEAKDMCVRLRFANVAGLNALENQLRYLRIVHFPASPQPAPLVDGELRDEDIFSQFKQAAYSFGDYSLSIERFPLAVTVRNIIAADRALREPK